MFPKHTCGYTVLQTGCVYVRELDSTCSGTCQGETQHVHVFSQWKREELCRDWKLALTKWLGLSLGYLSHHCFITLFPSLFNSLLLFCRFLYSLTDTYEREHVNSTYTAILREDMTVLCDRQLLLAMRLGFLPGFDAFCQAPVMKM